MPPAPSTFTAAQIANALGVSKRAVALRLDSLPAVAQAVAGGMAKTWTVDSLPADYREQLAALARQRGCHDAAHLLQALSQADTKPEWKPPLPLAQVHPDFIAKARKLRDALARPLAQQHTLKAADLRELGLKEFTRAFGYTISGKQWQRLLDRAVLRDAGRENWLRVDIYVEDAAFIRHVAKPARPSARFDHAPLNDAIENMEDKARPGDGDRAWLFHHAFLHFERLAETHGETRARRALKASLVDYLLAVFPPPALSKGRPALMRLFDLKLAQWREGGRTVEALTDKRPLASGNHRRPDFAEDEKKIRNQAIQLDGNESLAHLMLRERGQLSAEFCDYYPHDPRRDKSRVPRIVRDNITSAVEMTVPLRHSERALRHAGPWTERDWSGEKPGDWLNADDLSWNHLYRVRNAGGGWDVLRGECLVMMDAVSDYPITFLLIAGHYNSEHVVTLILRTHDLVGLPRKGFIFERGVWSGKLVKGVGAGALGIKATVKAFAHAMPGLTIHRAWTPRAKPIEGAFGKLQERMRSLPGFVGFNEQVEQREDVQKLIARARRNDPEALASFPTQEEWRDRINGVFDDFRHSPQNGKRLQGSSPAEAWNAALRDHALPKLSDDTRYLLATHCVETEIKPAGIALTIRGRRRCYANEQTGAWLARGVRRVLAFYHVEQPDLLTVSDLKRTQRFTVKALALPAMSATREQLRAVAAAKRAHLAPARAIFGELPQAVVSNITRDTAHTETDREEGRFITAAVEQHAGDESDERKTIRRIRTLCAELGEQEPDFTTSRVPLARLLESYERKSARLRRQQTSPA